MSSVTSFLSFRTFISPVYAFSLAENKIVYTPSKLKIGKSTCTNGINRDLSFHEMWWLDLPFNTETTKKFSAEKKTTENLRVYSVTWQSTLGEFVNSHQLA